MVVAEIDPRAEGTVIVMHRGPKLLRTRIAGHFSNAQAATLLDALEAWMGSTKHGLVAFHDCRDATNFEPTARQKITAWSNAHIEEFAMVHILVGNRAVAWGIRMLTAILGAKIVAHHSAEAFEAAFQKVLRSGTN